MQAPGYAMRLQQVSPKAHVELSKSFAALIPDEQDFDNLRGTRPSLDVHSTQTGDLPNTSAAAKSGILKHCTVAHQHVASAPRKAGKAAKFCGVSRRCSGCDNHTRETSGNVGPCLSGRARGCDSQLEWELPETQETNKPKSFRPSLLQSDRAGQESTKPSAKTFLEKRAQSLWLRTEIQDTLPRMRG